MELVGDVDKFFRRARLKVFPPSFGDGAEHAGKGRVVFSRRERRGRRAGEGLKVRVVGRGLNGLPDGRPARPAGTATDGQRQAKKTLLSKRERRCEIVAASGSGEPPHKPTSRRFCRARFSTSVVWTVPIVGGAAVFAKKPMPWTRR